MKVIRPDHWPQTPATLGRRPGGTATIADFLRFGRRLSAVCPVCLHSSELDLTDLAGRLGADHSCSAPELRAKLECTICKSVEAVLQEVRPAKAHPAERQAAAGAPVSV